MSILVRVLAIAASVIVLAVALLEIVPRVVAIPGLRLQDLDPVAEQIRNANVAPHPYLAYYPTPNYRSKPDAKNQASHNALGFRGPETTWEKPEGTYRIVCLGGSSTYGHGPTSDATNWPPRLETYLNEARPDGRIEVINAGCRGYSTFELLVNLEFRVLDLEPDLVIVYETINDMRCALYKEPKPDNTHWRAVWRQRTPSPLEKSYTFLALRRYLTDYVADQADLGSYVIVDFDGKLDSYAWEPGKDLGFHSFRRNLENLITLAHANGVRVVIGTQALRRSDVAAAKSGADQLRAFDAMTETLREVAKERELLLVDAQKTVGDEAERRWAAGAKQREEGVFTHEVHLTDEGCDLLARAFAEALVASGLLDLPPLPAQH